MWFGMLVSSAIIAGMVGIGKLFKNLVVDKLDKYEDYNERGWM